MLPVKRIMWNQENPQDAGLIAHLSGKDCTLDFTDQLHGCFAIEVIVTMRYAWSTLHTNNGRLQWPMILNIITHEHHRILQSALCCSCRLENWIDDNWMRDEYQTDTEILIIKSIALFWSIQLVMFVIDGYRALSIYSSNPTGLICLFRNRMLAWQSCWLIAPPTVYEILFDLLSDGGSL
jgi:hypothetical protein